MNIGQLGIYLLEASALLILLYIFNKVLLARETLHRLNRAVWLTSIMVAFALPLCTTSQRQESANTAQVSSTSESADVAIGEIEMMVLPTAEAQEVEAMSTTEIAVNALFWIYCLVALVLALRTVASYISLFRFIYKSSRTTTELTTERRVELTEYELEVGISRKIHYIIHNQALAPFSWANFIVVSHDDLESNGREIVIHELAHIKERHSLDIVALNIATIILWFNPAAWLTKRALQQVHEYCADQSVLSAGVNAKEYQLLLIKKAVGKSLYSISNSLNHSNLKNRITMILQKKSSRVAAAKCLYAIPLVALSVAMFSSRALATTTHSISEVKITNYFANHQTTEPEVQYSAGEAEAVSVTKFAEKAPANKGSEVVATLQRDSDTNPYIVINGKQVDYETMKRIDASKIAKIDVFKGNSNYEKYHIEGDRSQGLIVITLKDDQTVESATLSDEEFAKQKRNVTVASTVTESDTKQKEEQTFMRCEVMPKYKGGDLTDFRREVMMQIRYPESLAKQGIEGRVIASFVIDTDGSVSNIENLNSAPEDMFKEAKRVIALSSGEWTPGEQRGTKVKVKYSLPIDFSIMQPKKSK